MVRPGYTWGLLNILAFLRLIPIGFTFWIIVLQFLQILPPLFQFVLEGILNTFNQIQGTLYLCYELHCARWAYKQHLILILKYKELLSNVDLEPASMSYPLRCISSHNYYYFINKKHLVCLPYLHWLLPKCCVIITLISDWLLLLTLSKHMSTLWKMSWKDRFERGF